MLRCLTCNTHLVRARHQNSFFWQCAKCEGKLFTYRDLSKIKGSERALSLLTAPLKNIRLGKQTCPSCFKRMQLIFSGGGVTELDTCKKCKLVWFDKGEIGLFTSANQILKVPETISSEKNSITASNEQTLESGFSSPDPELQHFALMLFTLPEEHITPVKSEALITRWIIVLMFSVTLSKMFLKDGYFAAVAFFPTQPFQDYGFRWFVSVLAHADSFHFFGNAYFLWLFGDNVEDYLGTAKFIELFLFSSFLGHIAVILLDPHPVPILGASGAISGLGVFYMLSFPHGKLSYYFPFIKSPMQILRSTDEFFSLNRWMVVFRFTLPIWFATALFIILELYGSYTQMHYAGGRVSHLSHMGGALGGGLYWLMFGSTRK